MQTKLEVMNQSRDFLTLVVEPWAEEIELSDVNSFLVVCPDCEEEEFLTVEASHHKIIVHGIPDSTLEIYINGELVRTASSRIPAI